MKNKVFRESVSSRCFARYSSPRLAKFFFDCLYVTIISRKHFIDALLIELLAILRSGSFNKMLSFTDFLWYKVYLVFFIFNDNLLAMNQTFIFSSSNLL